MAFQHRHWGDDVVVVGGGIAGLTAAWHSARQGLSTVLLEGDLLFGGQVANIEAVDDFPSAGEVSGGNLATNLVDNCRALGVTIVNEAADNVISEGKARQVLAGDRIFRARDIIIASGCRPRHLGVPGEEEFRGRGVSQCAACDGAFFKDQDIVVVGGGDGAIQEALALAKLCKTVTIVSRSSLRAKFVYVSQITKCENVRFIWDRTVQSIGGGNAVQFVRLEGPDRSHEDIACSGVFPFIGGIPNTEFLPDAIKSPDGRVATDGAFATALDGVWAIGAVRTGYSGQLVSAAGEAATLVRSIISRNMVS